MNNKEFDKKITKKIKKLEEQEPLSPKKQIILKILKAIREIPIYLEIYNLTEENKIKTYKIIK